MDTLFVEFGKSAESEGKIRTVELTREVRGTEVTVIATDFDGDDSAGIPYGPETVYAKDFDGNDFPLTDEEVERFGIEATEVYYEGCDDDEI